ncbi:MAG: type II toxin-antitoxin system VapC family toxin [candidate division KSB1 bacterium]|nr:type II toxin-antitoxin system VapC family toxin [candidate division KSB1 bacterium]
METEAILIDSSLIIQFFRMTIKEETAFFKLMENNQLYISVVTEYELLGGATSKELLNDTLKILDLLTVVNFTSLEARRAAEIYRTLRRKNANIGAADIFIAATAINYDLPLATLNTRHFNRIKSLKLYPL